MAAPHDEPEAQALVEGDGAVHVGDRHHDVIRAAWQDASHGVRDDPVRGRRAGRDDHAEPPRRGERAEHRRCSTSSTPRSTLADADDDVRVVVLAGAGKHFSAGHDLKEILERRRRVGRACATRPRASSATSRSCTGTSACGSATSASPRSPRCRAPCAAAGLMLACMCDLIVAADDARFSNPVARMTGVGVELLVEPWELGPRKAKEFLLCAETLDAADAERFGLVNQVVPRAELDAAAREMADKVALVPPVTARGHQGRRSTTWSTCRASASRGSTTSWCTSSCQQHRDRARTRPRRASRAAWTR